MMPERLKKEEFKNLFQRAIDESVELASEFHQRSFSAEYKFMLAALGFDDKLLTLDEVVEVVYLGEEQSFMIIDVGVRRVSDGETLIFVRPSGHPPVPWVQTWNAERGLGPFKYIVGKDIT